LIALSLLAPAAATADSAPVIVEGPAITGVPQQGELLTATAKWSADPEPTTITWTWLQCDAKTTGKCKAIAGATAPSYRIVAADVTSVLRVRVTVTNSIGSAEARSQPTGVVQAPPPAEPSPTPTPPPTPDPDEPPAAPPPPPFEVPPAPVLAPSSGTGALTAAPLLEPFPVVRIRGWLTPGGARITLLSVRGPRGALITARCRGASCPVRRLVRTASSLTRLRPFERRLRAGTRLDITVRERGRIGKWTTIVIRRGARPRRTDRCGEPGRARPTACRRG